MLHNVRRTHTHTHSHDRHRLFHDDDDDDNRLLFIPCDILLVLLYYAQLNYDE